MPLAFNAERYFTYPMPGFSLRWYNDFFTNRVWLLAIKNSFIVGFGATFLATFLGTLAALGLSRGRFPLKSLIMGLLISPMAVPIVISNLGTMAMGVVDLVMIGRLNDAQAMAGVAVANTWVHGTVMFAMGLIFGIDPIVTQAHGARDQRRQALAEPSMQSTEQQREAC